MASYFLDPFGCAKNQVDAETMMALLAAAGWSAAGTPDEADLIIVNSCGFIESAKRESINAVLSWRRSYPEKKILLAGCLAQRYAGELARIMPEADAFFGNTGLGGIAAAASALFPGIPRGEEPLPAPGGRPLLSLPGSAYVKISEGCDNRCSFCSIPLIRGPLRSRSIPDIGGECRSLLGRGVREFNIIGQDIASFGRDRPGEGDLPALLEALAALPGEFWVRLLYLHPDHFPPAILDIIEGDSRFLPYFDIPFQHASGPLLRAMKRRGDGESYLDLVGKIRSRLPDAVIRSTFLTGFPGETEDDFQRLLDFQERAAMDWMGCFTFSREEDTPAYAMKKRVPKRVAAERKRILEERQEKISGERMERYLGRELEILIEEKFESPGEDPPPGLYLGRAYCQAPEVDGAVLVSCEETLGPGTLVRCRVTGRAGVDLEARVVKS
ncbi:MAG: 30S ribosomal protein S12 methylthiotransferase RimO [Treponema sp.]|nr:30S ribosomal protein S12 methylthiotransferase RimO [Treponema sp.]